MGQIKDDVLIKLVAETLKEIRNDKKLTQEEVYNDTNIHIGRIEAYQSNIRISTLNYLCKYYDTKIADFFNIIEKKSIKTHRK